MIKLKPAEYLDEIPSTFRIENIDIDSMVPDREILKDYCFEMPKENTDIGIEFSGDDSSSDSSPSPYTLSISSESSYPDTDSSSLTGFSDSEISEINDYVILPKLEPGYIWTTEEYGYRIFMTKIPYSIVNSGSVYLLTQFLTSEGLVPLAPFESSNDSSSVGTTESFSSSNPNSPSLESNVNSNHTPRSLPIFGGFPEPKNVSVDSIDSPVESLPALEEEESSVEKENPVYSPQKSNIENKIPKRKIISDQESDNDLDGINNSRPIFSPKLSKIRKLETEYAKKQPKGEPKPKVKRLSKSLLRNKKGNQSKRLVSQNKNNQDSITIEKNPQNPQQKQAPEPEPPTHQTFTKKGLFNENREIGNLNPSFPILNSPLQSTKPVLSEQKEQTPPGFASLLEKYCTSRRRNSVQKQVIQQCFSLFLGDNLKEENFILMIESQFDQLDRIRKYSESLVSTVAKIINSTETILEHSTKLHWMPGEINRLKNNLSTLTCDMEKIKLSKEEMSKEQMKLNSELIRAIKVKDSAVSEFQSLINSLNNISSEDDVNVRLSETGITPTGDVIEAVSKKQTSLSDDVIETKSSSVIIPDANPEVKPQIIPKRKQDFEFSEEWFSLVGLLSQMVVSVDVYSEKMLYHQQIQFKDMVNSFQSDSVLLGFCFEKCEQIRDSLSSTSITKSNVEKSKTLVSQVLSQMKDSQSTNLDEIKKRYPGFIQSKMMLQILSRHYELISVLKNEYFSLAESLSDQNHILRTSISFCLSLIEFSSKDESFFVDFVGETMENLGTYFQQLTSPILEQLKTTNTNLLKLIAKQKKQKQSKKAAVPKYGINRTKSRYSIHRSESKRSNKSSSLRKPKLAKSTLSLASQLGNSDPNTLPQELRDLQSIIESCSQIFTNVQKTNKSVAAQFSSFFGSSLKKRDRLSEYLTLLLSK